MTTTRRVFCLILCLLLVMPGTAFAAASTIDVDIPGAFDYSAAYEMLEKLNAYRAENSLEPLTMDEDLLEAAMLRAAEISLFFSHERPNGMMCDTVSVKLNAENIAKLQATVDKVMDGWKKSPGHNANMLDGDYQSVGIGAAKIGGYWFWVQYFGFGSGTEESTPSGGQESQTYTVQTLTEGTISSNLSWSFDEGTRTLTVTGTGAISSNDIDRITGWASCADSIVVSEGITSLCDQIFYGPSTITQVTLPSTLQSIGTAAFYSCNALTDVHYGGTQADWSGIAVGEYNTVLQYVTLHPSGTVHTHDYGEGVVIEPPTCTEAGVRIFTCACGDTKTETIKALGHTYDNEVCIRCGAIDPAHIHRMGEWVTTKEPTCTSAGEKERSCLLGDKTETETIDKLGHDFGEWTTTKEPSCTAPGSETRFCSRDDSSLSRSIDPLGHDYQDGFCTRCGEPDPNYVPPDHLPGDINGDGTVNNKDLTRLAQYLAGKSVTYAPGSLDVNGDGSVNNKDLTRLAQWLAGKNVELH